jgi:hypothetical protein
MLERAGATNQVVLFLWFPGTRTRYSFRTRLNLPGCERCRMIREALT